MREFKFRFWDTKEGKWLGKDSSYWKELTFEDCRKKLIASIRQGNIVAEQYTGLKDKDGKEIYEGDIVKDHNEWIAVIVWREKMAAFGIKWVDGVEDDFEFHLPCEIIGNIHENPELLEAGV